MKRGAVEASAADRPRVTRPRAPGGSRLLTALAVAAALLVTGCAGGKQHGGAFGPRRYKLAYGLEQGSARLPATARGATMSYLSYSDFNGPLGKLLLFMATAPQPTVKHLGTHRSCSGGTCTVTSYYSVTPPREEDVQRFTRMVEDVEKHGHPIEATLQLPLRSLGSEAGGWSLEVLFKGWRGFRGQLVEVAGGFNYSAFTYEGLLVRDGNFPAASEVTRTYRFQEAGFPLRVAWYATPVLSLYLRHDLNVIGLLQLEDEDERAPSLTSFGVRAHLPVLELRAGLVTDSFHPESATLSLEAALVF